MADAQAPRWHPVNGLTYVAFGVVNVAIFANQFPAGLTMVVGILWIGVAVWQASPVQDRWRERARVRELADRESRALRGPFETERDREN